MKYSIIRKQCIEELGLPAEKIFSFGELCRKLYVVYRYKARYGEERELTKEKSKFRLLLT